MNYLMAAALFLGATLLFCLLFALLVYVIERTRPSKCDGKCYQAEDERPIRHHLSKREQRELDEMERY